MAVGTIEAQMALAQAASAYQTSAYDVVADVNNQQPTQSSPWAVAGLHLSVTAIVIGILIFVLGYTLGEEE